MCCQLSRLQSVLHAAVRLIYGVRRYDHVTPLLQQLHWLSVPEQMTFKLCVMVYRCLHGIGPEYFLEDFIFTWRPSFPGRRSTSVERATAQCHLRTIFVFRRLLNTFLSSDNGVNNTNYCVVVLECLALSITLILAN